MNFSDSLSLDELVKRFEFRVIARVLRHTRNNQSIAADLMGMSRRTLLYRLADQLQEEQQYVPVHEPNTRRYTRSNPVITIRPFDYWQLVERYERKVITRALQLHAGRITPTAQFLNVKRRTLAWKITKLDIDY